MKKSLLATAVLALAAPSVETESAKAGGQPPPASAPSFYLAQDTATMKCQVVNTRPSAGGSINIIGVAHASRAGAETALKADKTCKEAVLLVRFEAWQ